jgi:hypothetical protein
VARLHGKGGLVLVGPTQGAVASPVAYLSHWDIAWVPDQLAVTARGDATTTWISGIEGALGTFAGFFDDASAQLYRLARDGLPRNFYLYPQAAAHDKYFGGLIVLTGFAISGAVTDAVAISASWAAAAEVSEYVTDFIINATASIHGSGSVSVLPPGTTLISGQSTIACTPIIGATANIAGTGQCGAIPRCAYLNGVAVMPPVVPIISVGVVPGGGYQTTYTPTYPGSGCVGAGRASARVIISDTPQASGQGVIVIPGKLSPVAIGDGEAIAVPIISAKALAAGAGVAGSGFSNSIQAKAAIAGVGSPGAVPIHSCTAAIAGAGVAGSGSSVSSGSTTLTVTATQGGSTGPGTALRVYVLTQAAATQNGATAVHDYSPGTTSTMSQNITTTQTGSRVYGAAEHGPQANAGTAGGNTTLVDDVKDNTQNLRYVTFKATSLTGTPGSTPIGFTFSGADTGPIAMLEVKTAGTLTEDGSAPAFVSTTSATTIATASFTAPSGSLLVACVCGGGGASVCTMTVSGGSLTWAEKAKANASGDDYAGVWVAQVP